LLECFWVAPLFCTLLPAAGPDVVPFACPSLGDCCPSAVPDRSTLVTAITDKIFIFIVFSPNQPQFPALLRVERLPTNRHAIPIVPRVFLQRSNKR
jgi:hypothetical protein